MTLPETYSKQHMAMAVIAGYALGVALVYWATRPQPAPPIPLDPKTDAWFGKTNYAPKPCACTDKSEVVHLDH